MTQKLKRTTFKTSREMDFFSEKELVTQTGHEIGEWPLVIVKELVDNSLDACEEHSIEPVISVSANATSITISDNGPGLPDLTLAAAMDFSVRASSREGYVSPTRGAQGNALMTLFPMPCVIDSGGRMVVETNGKRHVITIGADPISQRALVKDDVTDIPKSKGRSIGSEVSEQPSFGGTTISMEWSALEDVDGAIRWPFGDLSVHGEEYDGQFPRRFRDLCLAFAMFNPHLTLHLDWFGERQTFPASNVGWKKWLPSDPTSAHWYECRHMERLIGAYITHDRENDKDRLISEFIQEFDGLSASSKRAKVLDEAGMKRVRLSELVTGERLDSNRIAALLAAMRRHTKPVRSKHLGLIGEEHLRSFFVDSLGCDPESFRYAKQTAEQKVKKRDSGTGEKPCFMPSCIECAFGYLGDDEESRHIYTGTNFSASIKNPFRSFGGTGEGLEAMLNGMHVGGSEPVVFMLHLVHPRVEFTDRGKSSIIIGG